MRSYGNFIAHSFVCSPCHMIAALLELHHGGTVMTSLPTLSFGYLDESIGLFVFGAVFTAMPLSITHAAYFGLTSTALSVLSATPWTSSLIHMYIRRLDPFTTASSRAVDSIFSRVFLVFTIPLHFKLVIEQFLHMLQRDMISRTTTRRHMLRI